MVGGNVPPPARGCEPIEVRESRKRSTKRDGENIARGDAIVDIGMGESVFRAPAMSVGDGVTVDAGANGLCTPRLTGRAQGAVTTAREYPDSSSPSRLLAVSSSSQYESRLRTLAR